MNRITNKLGLLFVKTIFVQNSNKKIIQFIVIRGGKGQHLQDSFNLSFQLFFIGLENSTYRISILWACIDFYAVYLFHIEIKYKVVKLLVKNVEV